MIFRCNWYFYLLQTKNRTTHGREWKRRSERTDVDRTQNHQSAQRNVGNSLMRLNCGNLFSGSCEGGRKKSLPKQVKWFCWSKVESMDKIHQWQNLLTPAECLCFHLSWLERYFFRRISYELSEPQSKYSSSLKKVFFFLIKWKNSIEKTIC